MGNILFRTNAGTKTGLGHLVRCLHLARELEKQGTPCTFVLDYIEDSIKPFLNGIETHTLYDSPQDKPDPIKDAKKMVHICASRMTDWVILDDYRLDKIWEDRLQQAGHKVCAIDDLQRTHSCDMLIDMGWNGENTPRSYDALVPDACTKLLGPQYAMLSSAYQKQDIEDKTTPGMPFTITIGLGGSGNLQICEKILDNLIDDLSFDVNFNVILGPLSQGLEEFQTKYATHSNVFCLIGKTELHDDLCAINLYIGAAGGTMYQLRCLNIPALTFSIAANQENNLRNLEDIGHYFHLNGLTDQDIKALSSFVTSIHNNYDRVKTLGQIAPIKIDGLGCKRIARALIEGLYPETQTNADNTQIHWQKLSDEHRLRRVGDRDVNRYVEARNLEANCKNMVQADPIPYLNHYGWWFKAKRESWLLEKQGQPCLYIWHEPAVYEEKEYLIGGWFVCNDDTGFQDALIALNWQIEHCDNETPHLPWVAVISKQNKYVKLLNDYLGFEEITPDHPYFNAIANIFKDASTDDFHYVIRKAKAGQE